MGDKPEFDYKKLYFLLFATVADAVDELEMGNYSKARRMLIAAQQEVEEIFIADEDSLVEVEEKLGISDRQFRMYLKELFPENQLAEELLAEELLDEEMPKS